MLAEVEFLDEAVAEAAAARQWYEERSPVAASLFRDELFRGIEAIADSPTTWPQYVLGTRRYLMRRFPFFVVYRLVDTTVQVIAVAHARRRPGYWAAR